MGSPSRSSDFASTTSDRPLSTVSQVVASDEHPLHPSATSDEDLVVMAVQSTSKEELQPVNVGASVQDYASAGGPHAETTGAGRARQTDGRTKTSRSWTEGGEDHQHGAHGWGRPSLEAAQSYSLYSGPRASSPIRPPFFARHAASMRLASEASIGTGLEGRPGSIYDGHEGGSVTTWRATAVGSTPLERTIDAIGMGRYQYAVLVLSGLGWAADNMWLQGVAISLPRIQDEWGVRDRWVGLVSSSTFAGMMIGALAWGSYADTFGRKNAFNLTLLITAVFGMLSSFAPNFPLLCLCLFLLGTGVGGSMPTDGTIFLEALPKRSHYLLTALSVFFAAGSVLSSLLAFFIVPKNSCGGAQPCDPTKNKGWRYLLAGLGCLTMLFVAARLVFFTLFESPKFLVSAGKHDEARAVLQRIAAFNGAPKRVHLSDVSDRQEAERRTQARSQSSVNPHTSSKGVGGRSDSAQAHQPNDWDDSRHDERQRLMSSDELERSRRHSFGGHENQNNAGWDVEEQPKATWPAYLNWIPVSWRSSVEEGASRYAELFTPYWRKTTVLVWTIWTLFTLAYTMVNVFLPKYLESRTGGAKVVDATDPESRQQAIEAVMREFLLYSLASLPGSLLGAYLIETPLGRIKSMALSTLFLAFSLLAFAMSRTPFFVILSSCSISLFASIAYAVIYSYSPEVFKTSLRGTASGTASALSRLAGILAPVLAGILMQIDPNLPLYLGFALFGLTVWVQLSLPYETRGRDLEAESPQS